jgi:uncharacterized protein (TIGR03435 family)
MRIYAVVCALAIAVTGHVLAQIPERLAFDTVSIKPTSADTLPRWRVAPGRLMANRTVKELVQMAFTTSGGAFRVEQIVGGPDWVDTAHFAINAQYALTDEEARVTNPISFGPHPLAPLVRALLENRFKLATHIEQRELPVYALVLARSDRRLGPQLHVSSLNDADCEARHQRASATAPPCGLRNTANGFTAIGAPFSVVRAFFGPLDRPMLDRTGLDGRFDAEFRREDNVAIFTTLQEQLGLKLDPRREPLDVLVIDHVERPTED